MSVYYGYLTDSNFLNSFIRLFNCLFIYYYFYTSAFGGNIIFLLHIPCYASQFALPVIQVTSSQCAGAIQQSMEPSALQ